MTNQVWFAHIEGTDLSAACRKLLTLALGEPIQVAYLPNGKPWLPSRPEIQISLAHTRGAVAAAFSENPVGLDLEPLGRPIHPRLRGRCFTPQEQVYALDAAHALEVWTRKEASLKRDGRGIRVRLSEVETLGRSDLVSWQKEGYQFSFCGVPPLFLWYQTDLKE